MEYLDTNDVRTRLGPYAQGVALMSAARLDDASQVMYGAERLRMRYGDELADLGNRQNPPVDAGTVATAIARHFIRAADPGVLST